MHRNKLGLLPPLMIALTSCISSSQSSKAHPDKTTNQQSDLLARVITASFAQREMMEALKKALEKKGVKVLEEPKKRDKLKPDFTILGRSSSSTSPLSDIALGMIFVLDDFLYHPPEKSGQWLARQLLMMPDVDFLLTPSEIKLTSQEFKAANIKPNQVITYGLPANIKRIEPYSDEKYLIMINGLGIPKKTPILVFSGTTLPCQIPNEWDDIQFLRSVFISMSKHYQQDYPTIIISLHPGRTDYTEYLNALLALLNEFPQIPVIIPISKSKFLDSKKIPSTHSILNNDRVIIGEGLQLNDVLPLANGVLQAVPGAIINQAYVSNIPALTHGPSGAFSIFSAAGTDHKVFLNNISVPLARRTSGEIEMEEHKQFNADELATKILAKLTK